MTGVELLLAAVTAVELALCGGLSVVLGRRWRARPGPATGSAFGVFAVVAFVLVLGLLPPFDTTGWAGALATDVLICVLLTIPYLLLLFTWALGGLGDRVARGATALLVLQWVVTLAVPPLPPEGQSGPAWVAFYTAFVLAAWAVQSLLAAAGLWRAGRGQSSVVRKRMRALGSGTLLMALTLTLSASGADGEPGAWQAFVALLGLASIALFALAFLLPPAVRLVWRQADLTALSAAEQGLMTSVTADEVARTILPVLGRVLGGGGAALLDDDGGCRRAEGLDDDEVRAISARVVGANDGRHPAPHVRDCGDGVLAARLTSGWLAVRAGRLAPVFGDDEAVLLGRVATLVDLAQQRVALFEQERTSRAAAEAANAELETLLYSVSHDLRSPLISVLGYLDCLQQEHREQLAGDGPHYLDRISVNAVYMQSLISDLLELSRIGRSDPAPGRLDLQALAAQVVDAARLGSPAAALHVAGPLPVVWMSDVRARQLLTNLVDNALRHGGRDDLTVTVSAGTDDAGRVLLHVADDGRGIPPEYRQRVLQVFERLDAPKSSPGTGMGLAICKRTAESLGGSLVVSGPPPGSPSGTTVTLALPADVLADGPSAPAPPAPRRTLDSALPAPEGTRR